jgi:hypothetical protein
MFDPELASPVTTVRTITVVDILTLIALVTGPAIAVGIQLWFEKRREDRRLRHHVLRTLMAYRGRLHHPDSVSALNSIELVFSNKKPVFGKLKELLDHMEFERSLPEKEQKAGYERREDLLVELISSMSESLGYRFTHTVIKRKAYLPQGMVDEGLYELEMRRRLLDFTKGGSLPVKLVDENKT